MTKQLAILQTDHVAYTIDVLMTRESWANLALYRGSYIRLRGVYRKLAY